MNPDWRMYAIGSALFAAMTAIFGKIGVAEINSDLATFLRTIVSRTRHHPHGAVSTVEPFGAASPLARAAVPDQNRVHARENIESSALAGFSGTHRRGIPENMPTGGDDARRSRQRERHLQFIAHDLQRLRDARLAGGRQRE
jgi:hypothetical protein